MAGFAVEDEPILHIPFLLDDSLANIYSEWSKFSIYRVPKRLRNVQEEAYTPQLVSIGPFHHGRPELSEMELVKSRYFNLFCLRTMRTRDDFRRLIDEEKEKRIRACYAGTFQIKTGFVDMIITDATFIIELLLRSLQKSNDDYICKKPLLAKSVELDLILLENQLPFFVLEEIYDYAIPISANQKRDCRSQLAIGQTETEKARKQNHQKSKDLKDQSKKSSQYYSNCCFTVNFREDKDEDGGSIHFKSAFECLARQVFSEWKHQLRYQGAMPAILHFTDLLRCYYCPADNTLQVEQESDNKLQNLHSATKLDEAGINFESVQTTFLNNIEFRKAKCLRYCPFFNCSWLLKCLPWFFQLIPHLKCTEPTLKLPQLEVDDTTECEFRNLMAFEQCHYPDEMYICNYVWLMDKLINTEEDVEHLIDKKVVINNLGSSNAVAELFNSLRKQIVKHNSRYHPSIKDIMDHCNNPVNKVMATVTRVYFRNFWRGTATVVGIIVLVFVGLQLIPTRRVTQPRSHPAEKST